MKALILVGGTIPDLSLTQRRLWNQAETSNTDVAKTID